MQPNDRIMRMSCTRRSDDSLPPVKFSRSPYQSFCKAKGLPLNALDLTKLSMYIENSFRFSGNTSCPGGWDPEKILRYPLKISTVFSEILARISLRVLSKVLDAAIIASVN